MKKDIPDLEFSHKYDAEHAQQYFAKHRTGIRRRLSTWRESALARGMLRAAGDPESVLDIPCGAGRFWELLAERPGRRLHAADYSQDMIEVALSRRPRDVARRFETFQCSAFQIPRPDNFVQHVFCMRLMHHIADRKDRLVLLREFARVASDTVCVSLWVDGNYQAYRRARLESRRGPEKNRNRFVVPAPEIEAEFDEAGLDVVAQRDFMKYISMWRFYLLRKRRAGR